MLIRLLLEWILLYVALYTLMAISHCTLHNFEKFRENPVPLSLSHNRMSHIGAGYVSTVTMRMLSSYQYGNHEDVNIHSTITMEMCSLYGYTNHENILIILLW